MSYDTTLPRFVCALHALLHMPRHAGPWLLVFGVMRMVVVVCGSWRDGVGVAVAVGSHWLMVMVFDSACLGMV